MSKKGRKYEITKKEGGGKYEIDKKSGRVRRDGTRPDKIGWEAALIDVFGESPLLLPSMAFRIDHTPATRNRTDTDSREQGRTRFGGWEAGKIRDSGESSFLLPLPKPELSG